MLYESADLCCKVECYILNDPKKKLVTIYMVELLMSELSREGTKGYPI